jgi:hypothetical protein
MMGVFALIFLPFRLVSVFTGFTFTDAEDFGPLITLLIGLIGVALIGRSAQKKVSPPLIALLLLLSLWPILPNMGLFFMARELQSVHGSWPQVMVDDPKNWYGHVSPRFDALSHLVAYLEAFSGAWMAIFLALFLAVRSRLSGRQRQVCIVLTIISLLLVLADPGNLYAWWED